MKKTQWDQVMISCILKEWKNLTNKDYNLLKDRQIALNSKFSFSEANIVKLRKINDILQKHETEIHAHANRIRQLQSQWIKTT